MAFKKTKIFFPLSTVLINLLISCSTPAAPEDLPGKSTDPLSYLNHSDSARYVGMNTCKLCHQDIYNTFIQTGMGQSIDIATKRKSSAEFSTSGIYDKIADLHYQAFWSRDSMFMKEYRLE